MVLPNGNSITKGNSSAVLNLFGNVNTLNSNGFSGNATSGASFQGFNGGQIHFANKTIVNYAGANQFVTGQIPYNYLTTSGTGTKTLNADVEVDSTLNLGTTLDINAYQLKLLGNPIAGTPTKLSSSSSSKLWLGGSMPSVIIPSSISDLSKLYVNNASSINMKSTITIADTLTMVGGYLYTDTLNSHKVVLSSTAQINETQTSYVLGRVETTRNLPIGVTTDFGNMGVIIKTNGATNAGSTIVTRKTGIGATNVYAYDHRLLKGIKMIWDITPTNNGGLAADITFSYFKNLLNGVVDTCLNGFSDHNNSGNYLFAGRKTLDLANHLINIRRTDKFSAWTLGGSFNNPLPVELISFNAKLVGQDKSQLTWATAQEINNDYFNIERSEEGTNWLKVGQVDVVNPNSNSIKNYSFTDIFGFTTAKVLYYRLKQVDLNGQFTYSEIRKVTLSTIANDVKVWYNRDADKSSIRFTANQDKQISIRLMSNDGKAISDKDFGVTTGFNSIDLDMTTLAKGIYSIVIIESGNAEVHRVIKY